MEFAQVAVVLDALDGQGLPHWVAGGWGVAALTGRQTRPHRDLDLMIDARDLERCMGVLDGLGYTVETDWLPTRVELKGPQDSWVDVHPLRFSDDGNAHLVLLEGDVMDFPPEAFAVGVLEGRTTPCISAEQQRAVHRGYELGPKDQHDLAELDRLQAP
jgi:lincosamide nucleotidyltransferase A/C/D/E